MALTAEKIARYNEEEKLKPQHFFDEFAKSVTLYRDDDIWVIDKPHGLLSVDGKALKVSLQSRLLKADPNVKLIHRLDMDTSGIIIFARHSEAQSHISKQFIDRIPSKRIPSAGLGNAAAARRNRCARALRPTTKTQAYRRYELG